MLAGEATVDGGELAIAKGVSIVLHDQRPPRERETVLREYLLSGCAAELAIEQRLARLERAMADGRDRRRDARSLRAGAGRARAPWWIPLARPCD